MAKKVLYIASKESDYSRIKLIRMGLEHANEVDCILSDKKSYPGRILEVCWRFLWMKKSSYDVVVIGFFAQLIFPFIRLLWRGPILADCYISLYDSYVFDRAKCSPKSPTARLMHWLDGTLLRRSELCLTDTSKHRDYLAAEFSVPVERIVPVPISADEALFPVCARPASAQSDDGFLKYYSLGPLFHCRERMSSLRRPLY